MGMRSSVAVVVGALLSGYLPARGADDKDLAAAAKRLEGTWAVASAEHNGAPASAEANKGLRLVVEGERYENRRDATVTGKGTHKFVGRKDKVFHLDLTSGVGPNDDKVLRLIAEWIDGDTLRVCCPAIVGGKRPTKFTGEKGSQQELITFKRVKQ
jgi:uncharacterized protein (TIGR03067 family)